LDVPSKPRTVRQAWFQLFFGFLIFQAVLVALGCFLATGGKQLGLDAATRLDAVSQVFQSCTAIGVIACMAIARARMHPSAIQSGQDLMKATTMCLIVGELTVVLGLVGLAKLHLPQFLIAAALVFLVDFILILPAGLKLLALPAPKN
jgi:hypothetical protein